MKHVSVWDRARYEFDNIMSRGTIALLGLLFAASFIFIVGIALVVFITGVDVRDTGEHIGLPGLVWMVLLRTLDPGTMGGDTGDPPFLGAMLVVTFGGIFLVSILIGIISTGIQSRVEELRKGRSFVVEKDHTLILGWSPTIFTIISELVVANENRTRPCIAILAEHDKVQMEDEIRSHIGDTKNTRIVCRTGSPMEPTDLEIVNPYTARSIIIVSPEKPDPDSEVIKTLLALVQSPHRRAEPYHVVVEIRDPKTLEIVRLVGGDEASFVLVSELVRHILVQTCRQSGLSTVCSELVGFEGDEIYITSEPAVIGKTFGEAQFQYLDSALMGIRTRDGRILLNPPTDTRFEPGDRVIAISEDDDTVVLTPNPTYTIDDSAIVSATPAPPSPEHMLILGWNALASNIISELDEYVAPGSSITVVAAVADLKERLAREDFAPKNLALHARSGDSTDRRVLDDLNVGQYDHVVVLGGTDGTDPQHADSQTLITLLHLRDLRERNAYPFSIVSEMHDPRNRELAQITRADDFVVSQRLSSAMLAQVAENKELTQVFADLFRSEGSELYLKPAGDYVRTGHPVNFYTIVAAAQRRGETALGYRLQSETADAERAYGVHLNPTKSQMLTLSSPDKIIVLAEN